MLRSPILSAARYYRPFSSMDTVPDADVHWDMPYRPASSMAQHPASFPISPDLEYPSPVTSVSSYASPRALEHSNHSAMFSPQVDSRAGPDRVLTRRQRAAREHAQAQLLGRRSAPPAPFNPALDTSEDSRSRSVSLSFRSVSLSFLIPSCPY